MCWKGCHIRPWILTFCCVLMCGTGAVQTIASLSMGHTTFIFLMFATGLLAVFTGILVLLLDLFRQSTEDNPARRCPYRRSLWTVRISLFFTMLSLTAAVVIFHLHNLKIIGPWPESISSNKKLDHEHVVQTFRNKGIWIVTSTCVIGSLLSLFALLTTFPLPLRGVSVFSIRRTLCPVESSGWVYESSPRPGMHSSSPSRRLLEVVTSDRPGQQRFNKHSDRVEHITMETFKNEETACACPNNPSVHIPLAPQISKEKLVLVDSNPIMHPAPLNIDFGNRGTIHFRYGKKRKSSFRIKQHYRPLRDRSQQAVGVTSPERSHFGGQSTAP